MASPDQGRIRQLLHASNVHSADWDKKSELIQAAYNGRPSDSDVLLVSQTGGWFVVVGATGVALVSESGMLRKRIDVRFVPYKSVSKLVSEDGGYKDRRESAIRVEGVGSEVLFKLVWEGWAVGGSVSASDSAAERNRVLSSLQTAMRDL